ncbi:hypothetical protein ACFQFR_14710 [Streptomyces goshikiensis]
MRASETPAPRTGPGGSSRLPQDTRASLGPPKPCWWAGSACHITGSEAGSGSGDGTGSGTGDRAGDGSGSASVAEVSSRNTGPVSSTGGAGRLVPGTQDSPFQYRTYPGMDGSG